jgi:magnesium-transporting ATPase (P-type)
LTFIYQDEEKKFIEKYWADILVGKIIKVKKNEMIPADILIINSSDENGVCYLETTNLDGESALKPRQAIITYQKKIQNESDVVDIKDNLEVDLPNVNIYKVEGYLYYKNENNRKDFFSNDNILLRVIINNYYFILI